VLAEIFLGRIHAVTVLIVLAGAGNLFRVYDIGVLVVVRFHNPSTLIVGLNYI
jgi:hypothetical protein